MELEESMASRPKREVKYLTKNQLIDSFIDGEIEMPDFVEHMTNKMKSKKHKNSRKARGIKRLTEMFPSKRTQEEDPMLNDEEEKSGS